MVAIVAGGGLGLERTSAWVLGSRGQLGQAQLGRGGDNVYVNAATGNLVVQNTDEMLIGVGQNDPVARTYNSLGTLNDDNGDNWRESVSRQVTGLTGTVNTVGSSVTLIDWDGSDVTFSWDASRNLYVSTQGAGAYDTLSYAASNSTWTFTDGDTQVQETYDGANGRIKTRTDPDGNTLTFAYTTSGLVSRVTTQNGEYTSFSYYPGTNNLWQVQVFPPDTAGTQGSALMTRVTYHYDALNRLDKVTVDLTPKDVSDSNTYVTNYLYDGTSRRVTSITETDGSSLVIGYTPTLVGGSYRVQTLTQTAASGPARITRFEYNTATLVTTVTDPMGFATQLAYDPAGQLTQISAPSARAGAAPEVTKFGYDAAGNFVSMTAPDGTTSTYAYDANGNRETEIDGLGNRISRTFNTSNQKLTETTYPNGGVGTTTRYVYDDNKKNNNKNTHLRFVITPLGEVTEYRYNAYGQQTRQLRYAGSTYDLSAFSPTQSPLTSDLTPWVSGLTNLAGTQRTDTFYDFRGNVQTVTTYERLNTDGTVDTTGAVSATTYVYDQSGRLLNEIIPTGTGTATATYAYDGLGRLVAKTDFAGAQTTTIFTDTASKTAVTLANGLIQTSTYDLAGELISYSESSPSVATSTTYYAYDLDGRLRKVTDPNLNTTQFLCDNLGRKTADIGSDGTIVEYAYNADDQLTTTIHYAQKLTSAQLASLTDANGAPLNVDVATVRPTADPTDRWDWKVYDADQRLVASIDAAGYVTAYQYDGASQLVSTKAYASSIGASALAALKTPSGTGVVTLASSTPLNLSPVASGVTLSATTGSAFTFDPRANAWDPNGDVLSVSAVETAAHGIVSISNGGSSITYTPVSGYIGADSFSYTLIDGHGSAVKATATVNVYAPNQFTTLTAAAVDSWADGGTGLAYSVTNSSYQGGPTVLVQKTLTSPAGSITDVGLAAIRGANLDKFALNGGDHFGLAFDVQGLNYTNNITYWVHYWDANWADVGDSTHTAVPVSSSWTHVSQILDAPANARHAMLVIDQSLNGSHTTAGSQYGVALRNGQFISLAAGQPMAGPLETAPTAAADTLSTPVGVPIVFDPRANDADFDADNLTITAKTDGAHGTVTISNGSTVTYTPAIGYAGPDIFTYTISDGRGGTSTATVNVSVGVLPNAAPIATGITVSATVGTPLTFDPRANAWDANGDVLSIVAVGAAVHGVAAITNGGAAITYAPAAGCIGPDSFSYTLTDGHGGAVTATATVNVYAPNQFTTLTPSVVSSWADGGTGLPYTVTSDPNYQQSGAAALLITKTPAGANVTDVGQAAIGAATSDGKFPLTGGDHFGVGFDIQGVGGTTNVTYWIHYWDANWADVGDSAHITAPVGASWAHLSQTFDAPANARHAMLVIDQTASGTHNAPSTQYGIALRNGQFISLAAGQPMAGPIETAPTVAADTVSTPVGVPLTFDPRANDADPDADSLTITAVSNGAHGTVSYSATSVTYTPVAGYTGLDSFTYTVLDGRGGISTATVNITVGAAPDAAPQALGTSVSVTTGGSVTFNPAANSSDANGDTLTVAALGTPSHGSVVIGANGRSVTYTPAVSPASYIGADSFGYVLSDGHGGSVSATAFVNVTAVNQFTMLTPAAVANWSDNSTNVVYSASTATNYKGQSSALFITKTLTTAGTPPVSNGVTDVGAAAIRGAGTTNAAPWTLSGNDHFGVAFDVLAMNVATPPVVTATNNITYWVHYSDANGVAVGDSTKVTVPVGGSWTHVSQILDAPATARQVILVIDQSANGTKTTSGTQYGVAIANGQFLSLAPGQAMPGPANTAPVAAAQQVTTSKNTPITFDPRANDADVNADSLTITAASNGAHGTASFTGTSVTYTPAVGYFGADSFTYMVSDSQGVTTTGTVNVAIEAAIADAEPQTVATSLTAVSGSPLIFDPRANAWDVNGDVLSISAVGVPAHGTVVINGNGTSITYTPTSGYIGADSFTYLLSDGRGGAVTATASVNVYAPNQFTTLTPSAVDSWADGGTGLGYTATPDSNYQGGGAALLITKTLTSTATVANGVTDVGQAAIRGANLGKFSLNGGDHFGVAFDVQGLNTTNSITYWVHYWDANWADVSDSTHITVPVGASWTHIAQIIDAPANARHAMLVIDQSANGTHNAANTQYGVALRNAQFLTLAAGQSIPAAPVYAPNQFNTLSPSAVGSWYDGGTNVSYSATLSASYGGGPALLIQKTLISTANPVNGVIDVGQAAIAGANSGKFALNGADHFGVAFDVQAMNATSNLTYWVHYYDATWTDIGDSTHLTTQVNTSAWTHVAQTYDAPANARYAMLVLDQSGTQNAAGTQYGVAIANPQFLSLTAGQSIPSAPISNVPTAANYTIAVPVGGTITFDPRANDADLNADALQITAVTGGAHGTVTPNGGTSLTYQTTSSTYAGPDTFTYTISDGHGGTSTAWVNVVVGGTLSPVATASFAAAVSTTDRTTRNFYDADGRLAGTLDAEGYLTQTIYDAAGRKSQTVQFATAAPQNLWSSGSFNDLLTNVGANSSVDHQNPSDIHHWYLYDGRGLLRAEIDGEGDLTRYAYDASGYLNQKVVGQTLDPASLLTAPPTLASLPAVPAGTVLDTTAYTNDAFGKVLAETKTLASGTETTNYKYDNLQRLVQVATAANTSDARTSNQVFDARGRLIRSLGGVGSVALAALGNAPTQAQIDQVYADYGTTYVYDSADRLVQKLTPAGQGGSVKTLYYYDVLARLAYQVDPAGQVTQYVYDTFGDVVDTIAYAAQISSSTLSTLSGGAVTPALTSAITANATLDSHSRASFDVRGQMASSTDALGATTSYAYDAFGELMSRTDPLDTGIATTSTYAYSRRGQLLTTTRDVGGLALATNHRYDAFGREYQTIDPNGKLTATKYYRTGLVKSRTDATGVMQSFTYDGRGAPSTMTDGAGALATYTYSPFNRQTTLTEAVGSDVQKVTQFNYDSGGRLISQIVDAVVGGLNLKTQYTYDADGNRVAVTDPLSHISRSVFDAAGRLIYAIDADGYVVQTAYDADGRVVRSTRYATAIDVTSLPLAVSAATIAARIVPSPQPGGVTGSQYDAITNYVYDGEGRLAYRIDAVGHVCAYAYNSDGEVFRTTEYFNALASLSSYTLSSVQQALVADASNDRITRSVYDAAGRLSFEIDGEGDVTGYSYDATGAIKTQTKYKPQYSTAGDPTLATMQTWAAANAASAQLLQWQYDNAGRVTDITDGEGGITHRVYDDAGRMTDETVAYGTTSKATTHRDYDAAGRLKTETKGYLSSRPEATSFGYDALSRVSTITDLNGHTTTKAYDGAGRLKSSTVDKGALNLITSYAYDGAGNQVSLTDPNGGVGYFYYDAANRRTWQIDPMGYATHTEYDAAGEVTKVTRYANKTTGAAVGILPPVTPNSGNDAITQFHRDAMERLTDDVDAEGNQETFGLNSFGEVFSFKNKLNGVTTKEYYRTGKLKSETKVVTWTDMSGAVKSQSIATTYDYDGRGNRNDMIEAAGTADQRTTHYDYDLDDRLKDQITTVYQDSAHTAVQVQQSTEYDARGNVVRTTDANGIQTYIYYDATNRKVAEVSAVNPQGDGLGSLETWEYDAVGQIHSEITYATRIAPTSVGGSPPTTPAGGSRRTNYTYDAADRLHTTSNLAVLHGEISGSGYTFSTNDVIAYTEYDNNGNVTTRVDGNGNASYIYYDADGRKKAQVDAGGYLTTYDLDSEGHVLTETAYANAVSATATGYAAPTANSDDRSTTYKYDRNGRLKSETRNNVQVFVAVDPQSHAPLTTATSATTAYVYDGLGDVVQKTDANNALTYTHYDSFGRQVATLLPSFVDYRGVTVTPATEITYNGLSEVVLTLQHGDGTTTGPDRKTTNVYGTGGRLASVVDPMGFQTTFGYDKTGRQVSQQYDRLKSDGTTETDGLFIGYDAAGRETSRKSGVLLNGTWAYGDSRDQFHDGYGELVARGINTGGDVTKAQEFAEYDNVGRIWRTNFEDGVTKAYAYDRNGNATILLRGTGALDLRSKPDLASMLSDTSGAITETISVFDNRNHVTDTKQPASIAGANPVHAQKVDTTGSGVHYFNANVGVPQAAGYTATGAVGATNAASLATVGMSAGTVMFSTTLGQQNRYYNITLSDASMLDAYGGGDVIVNVSGYQSTGYALAPYNQDQHFTVPTGSSFAFAAPATMTTATVTVYKALPAGAGQVFIAKQFFSGGSVDIYGTASSATTSLPPAMIIRNEDPHATALCMFAKLNTSGVWSMVPTSPVTNSAGSTITGWFSVDMTRPPFNGAAQPNTTWDVRFLAMDGSGAIYDAREGQVQLNGAGAPVSNVNASAIGGPGQPSVIHYLDGNDWYVVSGAPSGTASVRMWYRNHGSSDAWSNTTLGNGFAGQAGLFGVVTNNMSGWKDIWLEYLDSSGNVIGDRHEQSMFNPGAYGNALTEYNTASRQIVLSPVAGATVQKFRYMIAGVWQNWIVNNSASQWTFDGSAIVSGFLNSASTQYEYQTLSSTGVVLSDTTGMLNLGYNGQSVTMTQATSVAAKVMFSPLQANATQLTLYYRINGSTDKFKVTTIYKGSNGFAWDVDAAGVRPLSGANNLEYYYDARDANNNLLPPLNGDDHVHGYITIQSDSYAQTDDYAIQWQIDAASISQFLIDRKQSFNAFGEIDSETDGRNNKTTYAYNTLGKLTSKTNPQVWVTSETNQATQVLPVEKYYYDAVGRLVAQLDANGNPTTQSLLAGSGGPDADGLTVNELHPDGGSKGLGYDVFGDLRSSTDELGAVTKYVYNQDDRLIEVDHPARLAGGNSAAGTQLIDYYGYDSLGERIRHTHNYTDAYQGAAAAETTDYDMRGRVTKTVTFGGLATTYQYLWLASNIMATSGLGAYGGWQTTTTEASGLSSIEKKDLFGNLVSRQDFGNHTYNYTYNLAGQLTHQSNSAGQSIDFTYYTNGYVASVTDNGVHMKSTFAYDNDGNRTLETYNSTAVAPVFYQNAVVTYDAMNRIASFIDAKATITYTYDANGNRREVKSVYNDGVSGAQQIQDYWYKYDSMNRFVLTMGALSNNQIVLGSSGVLIAYNAANERTSATYGSADPTKIYTETYTYSTDGYLENTSIAGVVRAKRTNDALGRTTSYAQYKSDGTTDLTRAMVYDGQNRVVSETDVDVTNGNVTTQITNDYKAVVNGAYTGADQGAIVHNHAVQTQSGKTIAITDTNYFYTWWDEAKQFSIRTQASDPTNPNSGQWAPGMSQLSYDVNGHLMQAVDNNSANRIVRNYETDAYGQVLVREEWDGPATQSVLGPRQLYYYFDGRRIGDVGNNGPSPVLEDYAQELAQDRQWLNKGGFRFGKPVASADFDQNYQPINSDYPGQAASSYTVRSGDTLSSIALAEWGDASLWYLIAEANGLSASTTLVAGQTLTIPNKVVNIHNTSQTFRVYNPGEAIGDTLPTLPPEPAPPPPKHHGGCGGIGQILVMIVAIAVNFIPGVGQAISGAMNSVFGSLGSVIGQAATTAIEKIGSAVVGGALGDAVGQGVAIAAGLQDRFSWREVGLSALSAGVTEGLSGPLSGLGKTISSSVGNVAGVDAGRFAAGFVKGAIGGAVTQGLEVATGLQSRFDWFAVAAGAVEGGARDAVGPYVDQALHVKLVDGQRPLTLTGELARGLTGTAAVLAGAGVRSALTGTDFGDNVMAELPQVIGQTVGSMVADRLSQGPVIQRAAMPDTTGLTPTPTLTLDGAGDGGFQLATPFSVNPADLIQPPNPVFDGGAPAVLASGAPGSAAVGGVAAVSPSSAGANAAGGTVDELVVTARHQEYGLSHIPRDLFIGAFSAVRKDIAAAWNGPDPGGDYGMLRGGFQPSAQFPNFAAFRQGQQDFRAYTDRYTTPDLNRGLGTLAIAPAVGGAVLAGAPVVGPALGRALAVRAEVALPGSIGLSYTGTEIVGGAITGVSIGAAPVVGAKLLTESEALTGTTLARKLGVEGEQAVGITGPKVAIEIPGSGQIRIPDQLTNTTLTEVKNVGYLSYTQQLRDFSTYSQQTGRTFELYVRGAGSPLGQTTFSAALAEAARNGQIVPKFIPGTE